VVRAGDAVLEAGYGTSNLELSTPATQDTVYEIASITKTFTAMAVALLVEEGSVSFDDPIGRHLPDLPPHWQSATLLQLVTHTSGIPNYTDRAEYWQGTRIDRPPKAMLGLVEELPLEFEPGTDWAYSSTGFYLLGFLIERWHGTDFGTALEERLLRPLRMGSTRLNDPYEIVEGRASGYARRGGTHHNKEYYSASGTYAAGGLLSSASDLARWDRAFTSDALLGSGVRERIWQPNRAPTPTERERGFVMGLGWFVFEQDGRRVMRHNGSIKGFSSEMARYLDDGLTVAICCNAESAGQLDQLSDRIAAAWATT
jgi:CubicO group peptidase (beta-lactamase class C family)